MKCSCLVEPQCLWRLEERATAKFSDLVVTATFAHIAIAHCIDLIDSLLENPDTEHTRFGCDFIRQKDWISRNSSNFGEKECTACQKYRVL